MPEIGKPDSLDVGPILFAMGIPRDRLTAIATTCFEAAFTAVRTFGRADPEAGIACICGLLSEKCLPDAGIEEMETIGRAAWNHYTRCTVSTGYCRKLFVAGVVGSFNRAGRSS